MSWGSGQEINQGRYEIIQRIGTGGFGVTYKAFDRRAASSRTAIAIKTLNERRQRQANFEQLQENFLNEAVSLARCSHPHVIRVDRVFAEGQLWAMVMEYIEGESLEDYIMDKGRLAETQAVEIIQKIGDAVSYVHSQQLLHRDIKPANIMIRSNGEPVLIDFGLAREFVSGIARSMTSDRTPHYSPPEQAERRGDFTPTLDVYALAATLYTCVTGDLPAMAEIRSVRDGLIEPKQLNLQLSNRVNQAIITGMALKSADRSSTVAEWLKLLHSSPANKPEQSGLVGQSITVGDYDTEDANIYYDRGKKLYDAGDFNAAIREFDQAIELDPDEAEYWNYRGGVYYCLKQYEQAVENFSKATELDSNNAKYWNDRGFVYYSLKQYIKAVEDYSKAIEIDPSKAKYWNSLGDVYFCLRQHDLAVGSYNKAVELNPDESQYWNNRGYGHYYLRRYEKAVEDYSKAIEINPNKAQYWNNRGFGYYYLKQYGRATENHSKAMKLAPNEVKFLKDRDNAYNRLKEYQKEVDLKL